MKIFNEANNPSAVARNISSVVKNAHRNILVFAPTFHERKERPITRPKQDAVHGTGAQTPVRCRTQARIMHRFSSRSAGLTRRTTEAPAKRAVGHAEEADRTRPAGRATQSGRMIAAMQVRIDA